MSREYSLGCVSFLNSKPLIEPLLERAGVKVHFAVPSALLGWLENEREEQARAALLPVVDYQVCSQELVLLPAGCIACAGPTLTVRIFSPVAPGEIKTLYCDRDSHTSVILAQVILRRRYGVKAEIRPIPPHWQPHDALEEKSAALLLIGDKVVNGAPERGYPYQLDLGEEWWELTGMPFVFACWMAPAALAAEDLRALFKILAEGQQSGAGMTERLLDKYAAEKQWPRELARRYFTEYLRYAWTEPMTAGLRKFYELAGAEGLLQVRREIRMCRGE